MTGIVEVAQELIHLYTQELMFNRRTNALDPNQKLTLEGAWAGMKNSNYYEIGEDLNLFAEDMKEQYYDMKVDEIVFSPDCRPPSDVCFMYTPNEDLSVLTFKQDTGVSVMYIPTKTTRMPLLMGTYWFENPKASDGYWFKFAPNIPEDPKTQNMALSLLIHTAMLFSLINQPRFVVQSTTGTRQLKRQMHRGHGISMDAWHKIEWNINEPVKAKDDSDRGGWRMPLHYTRGHWRKAQDHWDDVVIRKDGKPYKWIEGFWSGHPAYGVKKSYHAPKLGKNYENV